MTNFTISKSLFKHFPNLKVGTLIIRGFDNTKASREITKKLRDAEIEVRKTTKLEELGTLFKPWREAYSFFGAKPKKYKSSVEALTRRVLQKENLPAINTLVDTYNYVSIRYKLPLGGDDLSKLDSDIVLTFAKGNETFCAIGSDEVKNPGLGEIIYKMKNRVLCRRWNWRESDITKIEKSSKDIILYCETLDEDDSSLHKALKELQKLLGGEIRVLDSKNNRLDLSTLKLSSAKFDEFYSKQGDSSQSEKLGGKKKKNGSNRLVLDKSKTKSTVVHWSDVAAEQIIREKGDKATYVLESGITPSGVVHAGNFREAITADFIKRALLKRGKKVEFLYVWDDYDALRKVPVNLPKQDMIKENLRKPGFLVPDPYGCHESYVEHFEKIFEKETEMVGIDATYVYSHKKYHSLAYTEEIKTALEKTQEIVEILNKYREEPLAKDWLPIFVFCEKCDKDRLTSLKWNGGYVVDYNCECGYTGSVDFSKKGIVTLKWRVDWPMRWHHNKVDFESAGKDHFAAGGSITTGYELQKAVYGTDYPTGFFYEWIGIKGRGEFSSSQGNVVTVTELLGIYEPEIIRYIFAGTRPNKAFSISFDADVISMYEEYDKCERAYFGLGTMNDRKREKLKVAYELSSISKIPKTIPYQPGFRHLTMLVQINSFDIDKTVGYFASQLKTAFDKKRLRVRAECAANWIRKYAPEEFTFTVQETCQVTLADREKEILKVFARKLEEKEWSDKELHEEIYVLAKREEIDAKDLFSLAYRVLINKQKGPRLASFILEIGRKKVAKLFREV